MTSVLPVEAVETILARWKDQWGTTTPYGFNNEAFTPPAVGSGQQWVRVAVKLQDSRQETLGPVGGRRYNRGGTVFIQIFDEEDKGIGTLLVLAQAARVIFEGVTLDGLWFGDVDVQDVGPDGEGWYLVAVTAPFRHEETR